MSSVNGAWKLATPAWAAPVVDKLKALDAADAAPGKPTYDGVYLGVDLEKIAALYAKVAPQADQAKYLRLLDAADGLRQYAANLSQLYREKLEKPDATKLEKVEAKRCLKEGKESVDLLSRAMLQGVAALLEGRAPNSAEVAGFTQQFLSAEFDDTIKALFKSAGAVVDWGRNLHECQFDLFVVTKSPSCCFPASLESREQDGGAPSVR